MNFKTNAKIRVESDKGKYRKLYLDVACDVKENANSLYISVADGVELDGDNLPVNGELVMSPRGVPMVIESTKSKKGTVWLAVATHASPINLPISRVRFTYKDKNVEFSRDMRDNIDFNFDHSKVLYVKRAKGRSVSSIGFIAFIHEDNGVTLQCGPIEKTFGKRLIAKATTTR